MSDAMLPDDVSVLTWMRARKGDLCSTQGCDVPAAIDIMGLVEELVIPLCEKCAGPILAAAATGRKINVTFVDSSKKGNA